MHVVFDNIVFALQRAGGISVVWQELLERALRDGTYAKTVLDYPAENVSRAALTIPAEQCVALPMRRGERYRTPAYRAEAGSLFHSSYFRILPQRGVRNITTVHDLTYHYYRRGLPKWVHIAEEEHALRHSAGVICVSENTKQDLLHFYPWLREERIRVVYNGVSECFCPIEGVDNEGYLLYVGNRSASYKRFDVAVRVAQLTGVKLVVVGGRLSEQERQWLSHTLGEGRYEAVSQVPNEALNTYYNKALCLLYPSDYEGFGIPIIEAQRAGCPVVCQEVSSIPEVAGGSALSVRPAEVGRIAEEMADIVRQLQQGRIERVAIQRKGFENSRRFSWDETYRQTLAFYQTIQNT